MPKAWQFVTKLLEFCLKSGHDFLRHQTKKWMVYHIHVIKEKRLPTICTYFQIQFLIPMLNLVSCEQIIRSTSKSMRITANQEMRSLLLRFLLQLGGQSDAAQGQVTKVIQSQQAHRQHVFRYNFSELCFGDDLNSVQL